MKKVHRVILICDVLFVTAAIFSSVIDVFLGIEMADAGTHIIKIANLCRFCGFKKDVRKTQRKIKLEFERHGVYLLKTTTTLFSALMFASRVWGIFIA